MKIEIDREIFHQMMRGLSGGVFSQEQWHNGMRHKINLLAEKLAHETAIRSDKKVEIDV